MGTTSGARTAYPCGAPEFTPVFSGVRVTRTLVLCVCFADRCLAFCRFINVVIVLEQHSVTCVYESCKIVLFQKS
jgi:hypothetical protein